MVVWPVRHLECTAGEGHDRCWRWCLHTHAGKTWWTLWSQRCSFGGAGPSGPSQSAPSRFHSFLGTRTACIPVVVHLYRLCHVETRPPSCVSPISISVSCLNVCCIIKGSKAQENLRQRKHYITVWNPAPGFNCMTSNHRLLQETRITHEWLVQDRKRKKRDNRHILYQQL